MTTTLSSKGRIALPRRVCSRLGLLPGMRFDVTMQGETVVLAPRLPSRKAKLVRDRKTGLPTLLPPTGTPPLTHAAVRDALADFP
jgi:bifunctional DNA-binding transcriptional regulator/antitoxin component of YhaV-PrlF toxin-antitoxin module